MQRCEVGRKVAREQELRGVLGCVAAADLGGSARTMGCPARISQAAEEASVCRCGPPFPREDCPVLDTQGDGPSIALSSFPGPCHYQSPLGVGGSYYMSVSFLI